MDVLKVVMIFALDVFYFDMLLLALCRLILRCFMSLW